MNLATMPALSTVPSTRQLMRRALDPYLLLGMPHLTPDGLSETWLMKELGHRHWLMLALKLGMDDADFRTRDGEPAYAAICATSLQNAHLDLVSANDILLFRSTLRPVSRTQFSSIHHLSVGGYPIADVELVSTFVHRKIADDNQSLTRVDCPRVVNSAFAPSELAEMAAGIRRGTLDSYLGLQWSRRPDDTSTFSFMPSPFEEFNGAGLFYFAQFQALATRALEATLARSPGRLDRRDVFFFGNVATREAIEVAVSDRSSCESTTCCELLRHDGKVIGRVFTKSKPAQKEACHEDGGWQKFFPEGGDGRRLGSA